MNLRSKDIIQIREDSHQDSSNPSYHETPSQIQTLSSRKVFKDRQFKSNNSNNKLEENKNDNNEEDRNEKSEEKDNIINKENKNDYSINCDDHEIKLVKCIEKLEEGLVNFMNEIKNIKNEISLKSPPPSININNQKKDNSNNNKCHNENESMNINEDDIYKKQSEDSFNEYYKYNKNFESNKEKEFEDNEEEEKIEKQKEEKEKIIVKKYNIKRSINENKMVNDEEKAIEIKLEDNDENDENNKNSLYNYNGKILLKKRKYKKKKKEKKKGKKKNNNKNMKITTNKKKIKDIYENRCELCGIEIPKYKSSTVCEKCSYFNLYN